MILHEDWEFSVLGIHNYRKPGQLTYFFDFIYEHHDYLEGDICEAGVYRGKSLLATGLLLKELGSDKQVYGYDTFEGFPPIYHENDDLARFDDLAEAGTISREHHDKVHKNIAHRRLALREGVDTSNISLSGDFSEANLEQLRRKIDYLELDNVHLVQGPFSETMAPHRATDQRFMAALIDCDLYLSYQVALPFIWERLETGGYIFLDEYYSLKFPGGRIATDEFFASKADGPRRHKQRPGDFERWYVRKIRQAANTGK